MSPFGLPILVSKLHCAKILEHSWILWNVPGTGPKRPCRMADYRRNPPRKMLRTPTRRISGNRTAAGAGPDSQAGIPAAKGGRTKTNENRGIGQKQWKKQNDNVIGFEPGQHYRHDECGICGCHGGLNGSLGQ